MRKNRTANIAVFVAKLLFLAVLFCGNFAICFSGGPKAFWFYLALGGLSVTDFALSLFWLSRERLGRKRCIWLLVLTAAVLGVFILLGCRTVIFAAEPLVLRNLEYVRSLILSVQQTAFAACVVAYSWED